MSEKKKALFIGIVQKRMAIMRVKNYTQLARAIGMTSATFYRHMADPESFKLRDMRRITTYLRISLDELMEVWG